MTNKELDINQSIPEDLQKLYKILKEEVIWLNSKWKIFCQLFAFSEERIKFLAKMAPNFFGIAQQVLRDDILLSICRLTDPPRYREKERLSFKSFFEKLKEFINSDLYEIFRENLKEIQNYCNPIRKSRNYMIAHMDLQTALKHHLELFPPNINREIVEEALQKISAFMNCIGGKLEDVETDYEHIFMEDNGETIIHYLEHAKESLRRKKNK